MENVIGQDEFEDLLADMQVKGMGSNIRQALAAARRPISKARRPHSAPMRSASSPTAPWLRIRFTRAHTTVHLVVPLGGGHFQTFSTVVDNKMVEQMLRARGVALEVGFSLSGIWNSVKKVASKIGVTKVLGLASKVLDNPIIRTVLPVTNLVAPALSVAKNLLAVKAGAAKGNPKAKRALVALAAKHRAGKVSPDVRKGMDLAERVYTLRVTPA
jgi:hypothetical protein